VRPWNNPAAAHLRAQENTMEFGYFFRGIVAMASDGILAAEVEIRSMDFESVGSLGGAKIRITTPIGAHDSAASFEAVAARCLADAERLLPKAALEAWAAQWPSGCATAPSLPRDAQERWNAPPTF
jgi:hypothetical protein